MVNYHNHTALCGHARGTLDEYIQAAIEKGVTEFGFSDHAPVPEHLRAGISMAPYEAEIYIAEVLDKKSAYAGRIDVKLGFEVDFPMFDTFDRNYLRDKRIDFIIGSVHYLDGWGFDNPLYIDGYNERGIDSIYRDYYEILASLAASGMCDIIGHFDLVKKFGHRPESDMTGIIESIAQRLSGTQTAVEINTAGLQKPVAEMYPSDEIIEILFRNNVAVTIGSDSHTPEDVCYGYELAYEKLKKAGYRKVSGFTGRRRHELNL
jgi:histidinol-phosphatase (PHP family)